MRIDMVLTYTLLAVKAQSSLAGYAFLMKKGCWPTPTATLRCMR